MKAAPFDYVRPTRLEDVISELEDGQSRGFAKVLAGGQSLMPVLAMRLSRPNVLVDIMVVEELKQISREREYLRIGAGVRQRRVEKEMAEGVPLLRLALPWVGHREIRSRGTICGSIAHGDPAAELPAVAQCLGAQIEIDGPEGHRTVSAKEFFTGAMANVTGPSEVVSGVRFPLSRSGETFGFAEIARRQGDFALAGVAVRVRVREGRVEEAVVSAFGISDRPQTRDLAQELRRATEGMSSTGQNKSARRLFRDLMASYATEVVTTADEPNAARAYRRQLVQTIGARELSRCYFEALEETV
jgi:2-furoyl-CoA dehydrogenase FAD binding subunit